MFTDAFEGGNAHLRPSSDVRGQVPEWQSLAAQPEQNKENQGPVTKWNDPLRDMGGRRRVQNFFFSSPLFPSLWGVSPPPPLPLFCSFNIKAPRGGRGESVYLLSLNATGCEL